MGLKNLWSNGWKTIRRKNTIDQLITDFVMWWCKKKLNKLRVEHSNYTIFEIKGTGKDYPKYLMFTDVERVRKEMLKI